MTIRVGITGAGLITPLGNDVQTTWRNICAGQSGVGPITRFDASQHDVRFAAEVKDFNPGDWMDRKEARRSERFTHYAMAAARQAVADAGLDISPIRDEVGVIIGSGSGSLDMLQGEFKTLLYEGPERISPFTIPVMPADMAAATVSRLLEARGPCFSTTSACATGGNAIGEAAEMIKRGDARAMIAGGTEACVVSISIAAFAKMQALSRRNDDPTHASRPFDKTRDGFVMGEGAGVVILEDIEAAKARGAHIYAELIGYATTSDAHHITDPAPGGAGLARAIRRAIVKAGITPEQVQYVNAHGTSTPPNDRNETAALKTVFGDHAYKLAISSTKSMTGHMVGAAGGVEAIFTALALRDGILPPTTNYEYPDPDCDLDYIPNQARHAPIQVAISNSMGFGGHNAVLVLRRFEG
ncbi:MAG TPA: beta-ketoacyl-ACP synthase II [Ktedonobacterales bacterium]|nr:beta-ketoacyl-ACP synthase II [Ktedonobacterales bacterium]